MHDEHIQKYLDKNNIDNIDKFNSFMQRNQEYTNKRTMNLQDLIDKSNEEFVKKYHGKPNNKVITQENLRNSKAFMADNLNFVAKKEQKIEELRNKIIEETNKQLLKSPHISSASKKLAEKKNRPE